jgi:integrase/recombinase XerD
LCLLKSKLDQAFLFLQLQNKDFTVEDIYLQYKGVREQIDKTILQVFKEHNERVEKLIGKDYVRPTFLKYQQAYALLHGFLNYKYRNNNYYFKDLNLKFIHDYEFYLKTEKNLAQATVNKAIQRFRRLIPVAIMEGYLDKDPFLLYKVKYIKKEVVFLTPEELAKLENHSFSQSRLQQVKDMFVFCCYTGLAFNEMARLDQKSVVTNFDGCEWIKMIREKTNKEISVPLLPKALELITNLRVDDSRLMPKISNQKFNSYLKEIAEVVGIEKRLTHHMARKTFATTVLLYNDVPMEIVSELLGHSKMSITQEYYGKVVQKKVGEHMHKLALNLKKST